MSSTAEPSAYAVNIPNVDEKALKKAQQRNIICNNFIKIAVLLLIAVLLAIPIAVPLTIQRLRQEPEQLVFYSNNARVPGLIVDTSYTILNNKTVKLSATSNAQDYARRNRPPTIVVTNISAGMPDVPAGTVVVVAQPDLPPEQDPIESTPLEALHSFSRFNKSTNTLERFCRPFYTAGFNLENLVEAAMLDDPWYGPTATMTGKQVVDDILQRAAAAGLTTLRMWAHTNTQIYPFQVSPGQYKESGLKALDYVLDSARRAGLQVILSIIDNWKYYNGIDQYIDWSPTVPARTMDRPVDTNGDPTNSDYTTAQSKNYETQRHTLFWKDPSCKQFYKDHVATILNRNNTYNGRVYKDDPTIFAISLVNEPRCEVYSDPQCTSYVQAWIEEMAPYVKSIDKKHMVSIGNEGFYASNFTDENPQDWGESMGQDFIGNGAVPAIDFVTIHMWPDNWNMLTGDKVQTFPREWVAGHLQKAQQILRKPLLLEEFGKKLDESQRNLEGKKNLRDPVFDATYSAAEDAAANNTLMMGSMFWRQGYFLYNTQQDTYDVLTSDSTYDYVKSHASILNKKTNSRPPRPDCGLGCWVGTNNGTANVCVNQPQACAAWWAKFGSVGQVDPSWPASQVALAQKIQEGGLPVFPTKGLCCRAGFGAFADGCTLTPSA